MREREIIAINSIISHQQPPSSPLLDLAAPVGERGCGRLKKERMRVAQHRSVQDHAALVGLPQLGGGYPQAVSRDLNVRVVLRAIVPHDDGQPGHAFATDDADLDARLACAVGDNGRKPGFDEVDLVDALPTGFERLPDRKVDGFEVRFEQRGLSTARTA